MANLALDEFIELMRCAHRSLSSEGDRFEVPPLTKRKSSESQLFLIQLCRVAPWTVETRDYEGAGQRGDAMLLEEFTIGQVVQDYGECVSPSGVSHGDGWLMPRMTFVVEPMLISHRRSRNRVLHQQDVSDDDSTKCSPWPTPQSLHSDVLEEPYWGRWQRRTVLRRSLMRIVGPWIASSTTVSSARRRGASGELEGWSALRQSLSDEQGDYFFNSARCNP